MRDHVAASPASPLAPPLCLNTKTQCLLKSNTMHDSDHPDEYSDQMALKRKTLNLTERMTLRPMIMRLLTQ